VQKASISSFFRLIAALLSPTSRTPSRATSHRRSQRRPRWSHFGGPSGGHSVIGAAYTLNSSSALSVQAGPDGRFALCFGDKQLRLFRGFNRPARVLNHFGRLRYAETLTTHGATFHKG